MRHFSTVGIGSALVLVDFAAAVNGSTPPNPYANVLTLGSGPSASPQVFIDANNNPNASNTVSFQLDPFSELKAFSGNWTWTVKTSDVLIPPNSSEYPVNSNAHAAYTTYDFTWPEDGNLNEVLQAENSAHERISYPSCAILLRAVLPANVSKAYANADGSNCTTMLGAECVGNITSYLGGSIDCQERANSITSNPNFATACGSSLEAIRGPDGWAFEGYTFGNASASDNNTDTLEKGETYAYGLSYPYSPDNLTLYNQAKDNVHIIILPTLGNLGNSLLLCNRAGNGSSLTGAASGRGSGMGMTAVGVVVALVTLLNVL